MHTVYFRVAMTVGFCDLIQFRKLTIRSRHFTKTDSQKIQPNRHEIRRLRVYLYKPWRMNKLFIQMTLLLFLGVFALSCKKKDPTAPNPAATAVTHNNISYGPHARHKMDVYLPANRDTVNTKVFIWIHGGAWSDGDKSEFATMKATMDFYFPNYAFISLNYRLFDANSGSHKFPSQEEDIQAAVNFIKTKLSDWKISKKVVLAGGSAGGHLALLQAYKHNDDQFIKACVSYFPPTELVSFYPFNWFSALVLTGVTGGTPQQQPAIYASSSPVNFITSTSVPTIFFHGTTDDVVPIDQSYQLENKLSEFEVPHDFLYIQGEGHGFSNATTLQTIQRAKNFLEQYNP
jgi:acetyl esterase/lipase